MSTLSPILHAGSKQWMLGVIDNHTAKPMSLEEIEAHIAEHERLRKIPPAPTRAELIDKATQWMQAEFPDAHNGEYYARLGLMIHFITDITPE
jgi:hypothetical protein